MPAAGERFERDGERRTDFLAVGPFDLGAHVSFLLISFAGIRSREPRPPPLLPREARRGWDGGPLPHRDLGRLPPQPSPLLARAHGGRESRRAGSAAEFRQRSIHP